MGDFETNFNRFNKIFLQYCPKINVTALRDSLLMLSQNTLCANNQNLFEYLGLLPQDTSIRVYVPDLLILSEHYAQIRVCLDDAYMNSSDEKEKNLILNISSNYIQIYKTIYEVIKENTKSFIAYAKKQKIDLVVEHQASLYGILLKTKLGFKSPTLFKYKEAEDIDLFYNPNQTDDTESISAKKREKISKWSKKYARSNGKKIQGASMKAIRLLERNFCLAAKMGHLFEMLCVDQFMNALDINIDLFMKKTVTQADVDSIQDVAEEVKRKGDEEEGSQEEQDQIDDINKQVKKGLMSQAEADQMIAEIKATATQFHKENVNVLKKYAQEAAEANKKAEEAQRASKSAIEDARKKVELTETERETLKNQQKFLQEQINITQLKTEELEQKKKEIEAEEERKRQEEVERKKQEEEERKRKKEEENRKREEEKAKRLEQERLKALKEAQEAKAKALKEAERIREAKRLKKLEEAKAAKAAKAKAKAALDTAVQFNVSEKLKEIYFIICILSYFYQRDPTSNLVNLVVRNAIRESEQYNEAFYQNPNNFAEVENELQSFTDVDDLKYAAVQVKYKVFKNHFELLRGPVRMYLKLRKFLGRQDSKTQIFTESNANPFEIQAYKNTCDSKLASDKDIDKKIKDMVKSSVVHNFSRIYFAQDGIDYIFEDTIQETIHNTLLTENGNTIIMAYGPSGSGKTYNLIGDNLSEEDPSKPPVLGLIYSVLTYLTNYNKQDGIDDNAKIGNIELSSWQYYMRCGSASIKTESDRFIRFNSLGIYKSNLIQLINDSTDLNTFLLRLGEAFGTSAVNSMTYKFNQDDHHTSTVAKEEKGVMTFKKNVFTDDYKSIIDRPMRKMIEDLRLSYATDNEFTIDRSLRTMAKLSEDDINYYNKMNKTYPANKQENTFRLSNNIFWNKTEFKLSHLVDFIEVLGSDEEIQKKRKKFRIEFPFEPVPNQFNLIKQGRAFLIDNTAFKFVFDYYVIEAKLYLAMFIRFYEFGQLCITQFKPLIDKAKSREPGPVQLKITKSTTFDQLKEKFTKFYIAVTRSRPTRATPNNPDSSRTHLVINIKLNLTLEGKQVSRNIRFVDLAGNEKADENYFQMRYEGNGITTSLLAIKELLRNKQKGLRDVKNKLTDEQIKQFYTSCKTGAEKTSCKRLYEECIREFETGVDDKDKKLFDLDNQNTTISMYLNLPTYLKKKDYTNQCAAIADSLYFIRELQEDTQISKKIKELSELSGPCTATYNDWQNEKASASIKRKRAFGRRRCAHIKRHHRRY
jgi:hypothetical protein